MPENTTPYGDNKFLVPASIIVAGLIIAGAIVYSGGSFSRGLDLGEKKAAIGAKISGSDIESSVNNSNDINDIEDDDPNLGSPSAPVVLVEFSDFQCPFCRKFWSENMAQLREKYIKTGKVRFVYRDFPLSGIHPAAEPAAEASECADEQGSFWRMHDKIFLEQNKLGPGTVQFSVADLKQWAREIGLDGEKFDSCLDDGKFKEEVRKDYQDGSRLGVSGTPHIFVNGKPLIRGALPWLQVEQIIEQELAGH